MSSLEPLLGKVQESIEAQDVLAHSQEAISPSGEGHRSTPGRGLESVSKE